MKKVEQDWKRMMSVGVRALGLAVVLVCVLSVSSQAIWLGQSQVNPYLEVQGTYDSNIFRVSDDDENKESDYITVISPGIHAEFPTIADSQYRFLANYRANLKYYGNHGDSTLDPDEELNTMEHRMDAQAQFNLISGFKFQAGYELNLISVPPDFPGDSRNKYTEHGPMVKAGYWFIDRYEVELGYNGTLRRYDEEALQADDLTTHRVDATFFYRVSPAFSLLGGGGYGLVDRQEGPYFSDSTEYRGFGGVRFEATSQLTGILKAGAVSKSFDSAGFEDATDVFVSGEMISEFTEDTRVAVKVYRDIYEASISDDTASYGAYYVLTGLNASFLHTLAMLPNLSFSGSLIVDQETYPEDPNDRKDNTIKAGIGAEYKFFRYVSVGIKYLRSQTDSSTDAFDYNDDMATFSVRAIF